MSVQKITREPTIIDGSKVTARIFNRECVRCGLLMNYEQSQLAVPHVCVVRPPARAALISEDDRSQIDRHRDVLDAIAAKYGDVP